MKVSTQTRYAIRMLLELSLFDNGIGRMTAQQIASNQGISEKYLESIATKLQKGGFLISSKGFGGGYKMAIPTEEISLGAIMRLMETNFFSSHCVKNPEENCVNYADCVYFDMFCEVERTLEEKVNSISIADIRERYLRRSENGSKKINVI